ncbi:MAG: chemotaxis protein CheV [Paucimonas sp.]|nr:chemotaxis protein CheV [Paucimonas sp.]
MHHSVQQEVDERTNLTSSNKFELLLFRLGGDAKGERNELYGINVFKIREIAEMRAVTPIADSSPYFLGVINLRGEVLPVIDLPAIVGCKPRNGLNILLVTEFARTRQCFAVESVEDIVRMEWSRVHPSTGTHADSMVTSIAQLDSEFQGTKLVQVLDVETIVQKLKPLEEEENAGAAGCTLPPGTIVLAADDSVSARALIEKSLEKMGVPFVMTRSGKEAWLKLQEIADAAKSEGKSVKDRVALVLTDLEMPEMDGFTLTRNIKTDARCKTLPVLIHSSLSGSANEAHVKSAGADGYIAKFSPEELADAIRKAIAVYA